MVFQAVKYGLLVSSYGFVVDVNYLNQLLKCYVTHVVFFVC